MAKKKGKQEEEVKAEEAETTASDKLEFPFEKLDENPFNVVSNKPAILAAVPKEFYNDNPWSAAASHIFNYGYTQEEIVAMGRTLRTNSPEVASDQLRFILAWLGDWGVPKHEQKLAVGGWLLSLMFTVPPVLGKK